MKPRPTNKSGTCLEEKKFVSPTVVNYISTTPPSYSSKRESCNPVNNFRPRRTGSNNSTVSLSARFHSPSRTWKSLTKTMTSSPTRALPAVPQATLACLDPVKDKIDAFQVKEAGKINPSKDSPTERSLLRDFEQHAKDITRKALSIVPNCEEGQSSGSVTGISPTAVTDLNVRAPPSSPKSSNTPPEALTPTSEKKDESDEITPLVEAVKTSLVLEKTEDSISMPDFEVHQFLMMRLSQKQINRVSFHGIIHDINKEATDMASNDTLRTDDKTSCSAMIDEEQWLLSIIASRSPEETAVHRACPSTFSEAIGEVECKTNVEGETANPLSNLNASKTQLWKPSRSWWEARSGKNPWIEPRSHNKRWR